MGQGRSDAKEFMLDRIDDLARSRRHLPAAEIFELHAKSFHLLRAEVATASLQSVRDDRELSGITESTAGLRQKARRRIREEINQLPKNDGRASLVELA